MAALTVATLVTAVALLGGTQTGSRAVPASSGFSLTSLFTLYAVKVAKLDLNPQASGAMASFTIRQNSVASATFTARYSRK